MLKNDYESETAGNYSKRISAFRRVTVAATLICAVSLLLVGGMFAFDEELIEESTSITFSGSDYTLRHIDYEAVEYFNPNAESNAEYKFLEQYNAVVEPYADMVLHFYDEALLDGDSLYKFTICKQGSSDCQEGQRYEDENIPISFECSSHEEFDITVTRYSVSKGSLISSDSQKAVCLYVRREIRTMTESHRNQFLDAQFVMTSTTQEDGEKLYGDKYLSAKTLTRMHLYNAGQQSSDHLHDGNGFVTQHIKIQVLFEESLLSIDPAVVLPYWDYTIDSASGDLITESPIVTEMYGAMGEAGEPIGFLFRSDPLENARIMDGRWANMKAEMNDIPELTFGYGYMRAPWVMNPSPYVSRFTSTSLSYPSCATHHEMLTTYTDDMMEFFYNVAYDPHGPVHSVLGGIYGCDVFDQPAAEGRITGNQYDICYKLSFEKAEWFRRRYWQPDTGCVVNTTEYRASQCSFTCNEDSKDEMTERMLFFISSQVSKDEDMADYWYDFMCNGDGQKYFTGDQLEASSPSDPSFFLVHPVVERLFQYRLMMGGFAREEWNNDVYNDFVCDKPYCYDAELDSYDYWDHCCYGHMENDQIMLYDPASAAVSYVGMTNAEVVAATDPRSMSYSMPYIYDHFTWEHCEEDFASLISQ